METKAKVLETQHLVIRPSVWEDLDDFSKWERMPEVTKFFSIHDEQTDEECAIKFLEDQNNPKAEQFTIQLKPDAHAPRDSAARNIGRIVLADIEVGWKGELWRIYIADTALRGQGLGKEAMLATMRHCFYNLGFERLYLDHYTGNPAAYLYQSLGFQYEGVLRKNCRKNGILYDVHLMSMLREEYEAKYKAF